MQVTRVSKRCPVCEIEKVAEGFYRNKTRKDGLDSMCKECRSDVSRRVHQARSEARKAAQQ